jgi:Nif-specific regulatory protein
VDNELFGHVAGAYTGAQRKAPGKVVEAEGGTLFLDEVGELPTSVQGKLLRLVQDRTYFQVGASRPSQTDVRFVCATHRDLEAEVDSNRFRQDLYYRLRVVEIQIPPLRERGHGDLERLVDHFLDRFRQEHNRPGLRLNAMARTTLHAHDWPGNVRELKNCIESAVVLCPGQIITPDLLPLRRSLKRASNPDSFTSELVTLREVEIAYIRHVLQACGGNRTKAARLMEIGRNTLIRRLKED